MQNSCFGRKLERLKLHRLIAEDHVDGLSGISFMNTDWEHLLHLRDQGRSAANTWLGDQVGHQPEHGLSDEGSA